MPAWYLDRLITFMRQEYAEVRNPFSGRITHIDMRPENVHTLVLWSKNFDSFLKKRHLFHDYRLYFLFTINDMPGLEPGVPPLKDRIRQIRELAAYYGPDQIAWRFDPIVFSNGGPVMGGETFTRIAEPIAATGVRRVIISFLDLFGKVKARPAVQKARLYDPPHEVKTDYARELVARAGDLGLSLESCCEPEMNEAGIKTSSCIDGRLLGRLAGEPASERKDKGQRSACGCTESRDIGSYADMPCYHGCVYCYANPSFRERCHAGL